MNGGNLEYRDSVRSLPQGQLQNIRRMFEKPGESSGASQQNREDEADTTDMTDGNVHATRSRQPMSPPRKSSVDNRSPVRRANASASPSRSTDNAFHPTPAPRKYSDDKGQGLGVLPINKFGQIASGVALAGENSSPNRVSRFKDQLEQTSDAGRKIPLKPKPTPSPSRNRAHSPGRGTSPLRFQEKKSPKPVRRNSKNSIDNQSDAGCTANSSLDVPKSEEQRPISVFERSKMFENISNNSTPAGVSPSKPLKPPPPARQRSYSGEGAGDTGIKTNSQGKPNPPRPPMRQRSLVDKVKSEDLDGEIVDKSDSEDASKKPPAPPVKPKRTGAHDDYIKVKLEKEIEEKQRVKILETQNQNVDKSESIQTADTSVNNTNISVKVLPSVPSFSKKNKPTRPPPPRKKPRPFSIATDSIEFMSSEGSDSAEEISRSKADKENDNPFYEVIPAELLQKTNHKRDLKHWDLPRINHPEPIRRSLSAECIQKAVDDEGNILYMDPEKLLGNKDSGRGYDIYVDTEGYAVPNRLIRRNKSIDDTQELEDSWQIIDRHNLESFHYRLSQSSPGKQIGDRVKSKFRRFKNLFTDQDKSSPEKPVAQRKSSTPFDKGSQKRRVDAVRQKVSQAFEVLHSSFRQRTPSEVEPSDDVVERLSNDSDSKVDEKEIRKRVEYSRSIRFKTSKSIKEAKKYQKKVYPQLFENAMIVGLQQNEESGLYEPFVIYKFPEIDSNVSVPLFCFPDAANFKPSSSSSKSQSYNFVLTNFDGARVYGYCRRLIPPGSPNKIPEVICIISPVDAFAMYNNLLEEIEHKRQVSLDAAQELIAAAFGRPLPAPGQSETVRTLDEHGEMETLFVTRETDNRIENVNCECLLTNLGSEKLLKVFATILLERSVLFCAKHLSTLSSTIHAIVSLLYPFSWQHTFIPVLPSQMIDVVCSPTPYIMGITTALLPKTTDLPIDENVLIVDIDKRSFIKCQGDEGTLLPKKIEKALKTSLNMCRIDADARESPNVMISEAFLRFFIEVIGHYGQFIDTKEGKYVFQKEEFVKGVRSSTLQQLLEWFVETQMFEVFMTKQLKKKDWGNTIAFFESRLQEHLFTTGQKRRLGKKSSALQ